MPPNQTNMKTTDPPRIFRTVVRRNNCQFDVNISIRTRLESEKEIIPQKLYSPIIYQFHQQIQGDCGESFVVSRCTVRECKNNGVIKVKGDSGDVVLSKKMDKNEISGVSKIKIQESSFNHQKSSFFMEFSYFTHNNMESAALVKRSPNFFVYSRKPKKKKASSAKTELVNKNSETILGKRSRTDHSHYKRSDHSHGTITTTASTITSTMVNTQDNTGGLVKFIPSPPAEFLSFGGFPKTEEIDSSAYALAFQPPLKKRKFNYGMVDGKKRMGSDTNDSNINTQYRARLNDFIGFVENMPVKNKSMYLTNSIYTILGKLQQTLGTTT